MDNYQQKATESLTESIRSGDYYNQARKWYFVLFSNPIAERSFYLVTFLIAMVTLAISVMAVLYILPLSSIYPFFVKNDRINTKVPQIIKLRQNTRESQDFALMRFFVRSYVQYRESYSQDTFDLSDKFVANYSDEATLQSYRQLMDVANPASPRLLFSDPWIQRVVAITNVQMNLESQPYQALVRFDVSVRGNNTGEVIPYTADVRFYYSPLQAVEELDSTGKKVSRFKQPEFQVVSYNVQQSAAQSANQGNPQAR